MKDFNFAMSNKASVPPPPCPTLWSGRRAHSLAGEGLGESQFRRGYCSALYITLWLQESIV
jgi:hypothetical protein